MFLWHQELEKERTDLLEDVTSNKRKMKELEDNLLYRLTSTQAGEYNSMCYQKEFEVISNIVSVWIGDLGMITISVGSVAVQGAAIMFVFCICIISETS